MWSKADVRTALALAQPVVVESSDKRFADGAQYRVEIPSVEGPLCLEAVIQTAAELVVPIHRVSQGSGSSLYSSAELRRMSELAAEAGIEVSLFGRPVAPWGISAGSRAPLGALMAGSAHGNDQVMHVLEDIRRTADHGIRSVLIGDLGVLEAFRRLRASGLLPPDMQAKISAMLPVTNALTASVLERLGANTINIASDLTIGQIAEIRAAVHLPLDIYVEAPDNLGGFVREYEIAELVRVAAPVYLKFGLRNAPDVYPSGGHLDELTVRLSAERVRRAAIALELLRALLPDATTSTGRPVDLAIPVAANELPPPVGASSR